MGNPKENKENQENKQNNGSENRPEVRPENISGSGRTNKPRVRKLSDKNIREEFRQEILDNQNSPLPRERQTEGEINRLTEKELYRYFARNRSIIVQAYNLRNLRSITDEEGNPLPENELKKLDDLVNRMMGLQSSWQKYAEAYTTITFEHQDARKEAEAASLFLSDLKACRELFQSLSENPLLAGQQSFAEAEFFTKNLAGHYDEMTNGALNLEGKDIPAPVSDDDIDLYTTDESWNQITGRIHEKGYHSTRYTYADRQNDPLFPHEPCPDDIMQGAVGDCYFIATLSAIVAQNPQYIKNMMRDNGDGTVTARIHGLGDGESYLTLRKTAPVAQGYHFHFNQKHPEIGVEEDLFAKNSLWVQMAEKLAAAARVRVSKKTAESTKAAFRELKGGALTDGLYHIFGKKNLHAEAYYKETQIENDEFYQQIHEAIGKKHIVVAASLPEDLPAELKAKYEEALATEKAINEKRAAEKKLDDYDLVTAAASRACFGLSMKAKYSQEKKCWEPIFAPHEYAVMDAYEEDGKKYIVVRNPHGRDYARPDAASWKETDDKPLEKTGGYSVIPLELYRKCMTETAVAEPYPPQAYHDAMKGYRGISVKMFNALENSKSWAARKTDGKTMSTEFRELHQAMREAAIAANTPLICGTTLRQTFKTLEEKAEKYLLSRSEDRYSSNGRNMRVAIAKAAVTIAQSIQYGEYADVPQLVQNTERMILADRLTYIVHGGKKHIDEEKMLQNKSYQEFADKLPQEQISKLAFTTDAAGLSKAVITAIVESQENPAAGKIAAPAAAKTVQKAAGTGTKNKSVPADPSAG